MMSDLKYGLSLTVPATLACNGCDAMETTKTAKGTTMKRNDDETIELKKHEAILLASCASKKDETRPSIEQVFFDVDDKGEMKIVSTDGHRMVILSDPLQGRQHGTSFGVSASALEKAAKIIKARDTLIVSASDTKTVIEAGVSVIEGKAPGDTFPKWRQVAKESMAPPAADVDLNPEYLVDLIKYRKAELAARLKEHKQSEAIRKRQLGKSYIEPPDPQLPMTIRLHEELEPIHCLVGDVRYIVMPMRREAY